MAGMKRPFECCLRPLSGLATVGDGDDTSGEVVEFFPEAFAYSPHVFVYVGDIYAVKISKPAFPHSTDGIAGCYANRASENEYEGQGGEEPHLRSGKR